MTSVPVLLSMGSNLDPEDNLERAVELLARRTDLIAVSSVFRTEPVGAPNSPDFLNAAAKIRFVGSPQALKFDVLRPIEDELGRIRSDDRNAPRTIDLDISLFGRLVMYDQDCDLVIPAPEVMTQAHVALPLADLAPDMIHPVCDEPLAEIAARFGSVSGIEKLTRPILSAKDRAGVDS